MGTLELVFKRQNLSFKMPAFGVYEINPGLNFGFHFLCNFFSPLFDIENLTCHDDHLMISLSYCLVRVQSIGYRMYDSCTFILPLFHVMTLLF